MSKEPISQYYYSHRLKLHFWDWGHNGKPNLILVHGGMDHARSWDRIAEAFIGDYRILAPDLRGHGDSSWAPGAMYSVAEYLLDLSALADIAGDEPIYFIGHSLGAAIVLQYAGVYPERVRKIVAIEGVAPPPSMQRPYPVHKRLRDWIETIRDYEKRTPRRYRNLEAAYQRMHQANAYLSNEMARHLTLFGSNWNADGTLIWKFDNFVRAIAPYAFNMAESHEIWNQITCPVLLFRGMDSWTDDPNKEGLISSISGHKLIEVPNAGHWVHHDQPDVFIGETRDFFNAP
ncbi:MAG TPA: alpha/beta hydrolase [Acidobacteriota bacterium]|nr:alpha/beta hydrolase [Acidobacteriota bacterium]